MKTLQQPFLQRYLTLDLKLLCKGDNIGLKIQGRKSPPVSKKL